MQDFFKFLYRFRSFLLFLGLEALCFYLIFRVNNYHGTRFFNSSNVMVAQMMDVTSNVTDYFYLRETNENLANENAGLQNQIEYLNKIVAQLNTPPDTLIQNSTDSTKSVAGDTLGYEIGIPGDHLIFNGVSAQIVNNSVSNFNNFITIDKGANNGIAQGQGVVSSNGVVGIVRNVSSNFAVVYSLLNSKVMISSKLKRTGDIATVKWDGVDYRYAEIKYLPRHIKVQKGDSIITSGYDAIFPENVLVGVIEELNTKEHSEFHELKLRLSSDFSSIRSVYVLENISKPELDSVRLNLGEELP